MPFVHHELPDGLDCLRDLRDITVESQVVVERNGKGFLRGRSLVRQGQRARSSNGLVGDLTDEPSQVVDRASPGTFLPYGSRKSFLEPLRETFVRRGQGPTARGQEISARIREVLPVLGGLLSRPVYHFPF